MGKSSIIFILIYSFIFTVIFPVFNTYSEPLVCNCVKWIRAKKVGNLPYGLWNIRDKRRIVNSQKARVGTVAIIDTSSSRNPSYRNVGHVAYVYKVSGKEIYIEEVNFKHCEYTKRHGSKSALRIVGFYDPKVGSGNDAPDGFNNHCQKCKEYKAKYDEASQKKAKYKEKYEKYKEKYEKTGKKKHKKKYKKYKKKYKKWKKKKSKYKEKYKKCKKRCKN